MKGKRREKRFILSVLLIFKIETKAFFLGSTGRFTEGFRWKQITLPSITDAIFYQAGVLFGSPAGNSRLILRSRDGILYRPRKNGRTILCWRAIISSVFDGSGMWLPSHSKERMMWDNHVIEKEGDWNVWSWNAGTGDYFCGIAAPFWRQPHRRDRQRAGIVD